MNYTAPVLIPYIMHLFTHKGVASLFAVVMCFAATANAAVTDYGAVYKMDIQNGTAPFGWTIATGASIAQYQYSDGTYALDLIQGGGSGNRNCSYTFASNTLFTEATDYIFEFDWGIATSNKKSTTFTVNADNDNKALFVITNEPFQTNCKVSVSDSIGVITGTDGYIKGMPQKLFHFTITGNSEGVQLSITKDGTTYVNERVSDTLCHITGITADLGRAETHIALANIQLSTPVADDYVAEPTLSTVGSDYGIKTVSLSCDTEGATIYYTINGGDKQTENPFSISETSDVVVWAEKNGTKSSEKSASITAGAVPTPTIYRPVGSGENNSLRISCATNEVTIQYKVGDGEYQNYEQAITVDGTTKVTAKAVYVDGNVTFSSDEVEVEITPETLISAAKEIEFTFATRGKNAIVPTIGSEAIVSVSDVNYYSFTMGDYGTVENFAVEKFSEESTANGYQWWLRGTDKDTSNGALYLYAESKRFALPTVKAGQYVVITGHKGNADFVLTLVDNGVAELVDASTQANSIYTYKVIKDGTLAILMGLNGYLDNINVYEPVSSYDLSIDSKTGVATFFWDKAATIPEGATVYYGELSTNEEETVLNLKEIEGTIPANTAVIVSASDKETVTFESTDAVDAIKGNALKGSVTAISDYTAGSIYMLGNKNGLAFYQYAGTSIPANRAYLEIASEAEAEGEAESAPAIRVVFGGTSDNVTGIENIAVEAESVKTAFDLQGRRVLNMSRPGLYIVGGKKVLVK